MDRPLGTSQAREHLPRLIQEAERGRSTYITRRGASGPVAAVVPVSVADRDPDPAPSRPLPSASGGVFAPGEGGRPTAAEHDWVGAALGGMHHRLTEVVAAATRALATVGSAQAALVAGDTTGAVDQAAASGLRRALEQVGGTGVEASLLRDALADPGPAECSVCGEALQRWGDGTGWSHMAQHPDSGQWEVIYPLDAHAPVARHMPPTRPHIHNGQLTETW